jgi:hypothetical protein
MRTPATDRVLTCSAVTPASRSVAKIPAAVPTPLPPVPPRRPWRVAPTIAATARPRPELVAAIAADADREIPI